MSQTPTDSIQVEIGENQITTSKSARCLGVQWRRDLSANDSVNINISKARRAFFRLGSTGAFHGKLNPLSASSIFETCIIPICVMVPPIHLGAWSMALMLWLPFELLLLLLFPFYYSDLRHGCSTIHVFRHLKDSNVKLAAGY